MCGLIDTIYALSVKDWFDYMAVIVPIVLSVVAIWISLYTVHTQNRIALFEMNYAALHQIRAILEFAECTELCENRVHLAVHMDAFFGSGLDLQMEHRGWSHVFGIINQIEKRALVKSLIRSKMDELTVRRMIEKLRYLMLAVYAAPESKFEMKEVECFRDLCEKYGEVVYKKLEKRVRI